MLLEIILLLFVFVLIAASLKKPSNYPPGPWGLPFIGFLPKSLEDYGKKLLALKKKHGSITSWRIGTKFVVSLFDFNLVKEAFQSPNLSNKPNFKILCNVHDKNAEPLGIISSNGVLWHTNRRFALRHLRDFGMSRSRVLPVAHNEADFFIKELKKQVGQPAPFPHSMSVAILNVLWQMVGSKRYELDDEEIEKYFKLVFKKQSSLAKLLLLDIFPWIKNLIPNRALNSWFKLDVQRTVSDEIKIYFKKSIDEHIQDLDEQNPRDYIDVYLIEMKKQEQNPDSRMSVDDLIICLSDLFEGGTETSNIAIHWACLYLAKFPRVQKRLQKEIDEVLPGGMAVTLEDKSRLPYTEAFIHETLRYSSVSPNILRETSSEIQLAGYTIPKGTIVVNQSLIMHFDSKYFDSPNEFRPERFLDSDGNFVAPKDGFSPFGYGKRACIGEILARVEIMVFLTKLVQNYHFEYPPGEEYDLEPTDNPLIRMPKGSSNLLISLR